MKIGKPNRFAVELVQMRSSDDRITVTGQVSVALIIRHNQNDIRPAFLSRTRERMGREDGAAQNSRPKDGFEKSPTRQRALSSAVNFRYHHFLSILELYGAVRYANGNSHVLYRVTSSIAIRAHSQSLCGW